MLYDPFKLSSCFLVFSWALLGCAVAPELQQTNVQEEYFHGTSTTSSPDGKTPYGPPVATLAKRVWSDARTITEYTRHGDKAITSTITQTDDPLVTIATDATASFKGEMRITQGTWRSWEKWSYKIQITEGSGLLTGDGWMEGDMLKTKKVFHDSSGTPRALIQESLRRITAKEYESLLASWPTKKPE